MLDFQIKQRDFGYGSGHISPDQKSFFINIPKNASSFIGNWLHESGWTVTTANKEGVDWGDLENCIIVLRDPLERWVFGISQYIKSYALGGVGDNKTLDPQNFIDNYNHVVERILFEQPNIFDDHVWPQYCFFETIFCNTNKIYFYMNENFEKNLQTRLNLANIDKSILDYHKSENDPDLKILKKFFAGKIRDNKKLHKRIIKTYKTDYDLIESVDLIK